MNRVTWSGDGVLLSASLLGCGPHLSPARAPHHLATASVAVARRALPGQQRGRQSRVASVDRVGSSLTLSLAWMRPIATPTRAVQRLAVLSTGHHHHSYFCPSLDPSRCCLACLSFWAAGSSQTATRGRLHYRALSSCRRRRSEAIFQGGPFPRSGHFHRCWLPLPCYVRRGTTALMSPAPAASMLALVQPHPRTHAMGTPWRRCAAPRSCRPPALLTYGWSCRPLNDAGRRCHRLTPFHVCRRLRRVPAALPRSYHHGLFFLALLHCRR